MSEPDPAPDQLEALKRSLTTRTTAVANERPEPSGVTSDPENARPEQVHEVTCPVCARRVESMTMGRETGLLIWHAGPHILGDTPCAFPTPPSRRDLSPRPAGEHGRTGERVDRSALDLLHEYQTNVGWRGRPDYVTRLTEWEIAMARLLVADLRDAPAARPAPAELDEATIEQLARLLRTMLTEHSARTIKPYDELSEGLKDTFRNKARQVASVLAAPSGVAPAGKAPHRCECGHTLDQHDLADEGDEPCEEGGCGCPDWNSAAQPPPADTPEEADNA